MSFKVLVNCRSEHKLQNFFSGIDGSCECLSTSGFTEDILLHVDYYHPDVFISIFDTLDYNIMQQFYILKGKSKMNGIPFIMIANAEVCRAAQEKVPDLFDYIYTENEVLSRPRGVLSEVARNSVGLGDSFVEGEASEKKHIMVVDDDKTTLRLLKTALEEKSYTVTAIASGKVAKKFLQTKTVDLILLDYQMPVENGAEVLKWLRSDERLKEIPVIFLTGVSDSERVQEVISMRPQGYLLKPVNMERLFIMIRCIL